MSPVRAAEGITWYLYLPAFRLQGNIRVSPNAHLLSGTKVLQATCQLQRLTHTAFCSCRLPACCAGCKDGCHLRISFCRAPYSWTGYGQLLHLGTVSDLTLAAMPLLLLTCLPAYCAGLHAHGCRPRSTCCQAPRSWRAWGLAQAWGLHTQPRQQHTTGAAACCQVGWEKIAMCCASQEVMCYVWQLISVSLAVS
jgi:hypothetical protein